MKQSQVKLFKLEVANLLSMHLNAFFIYAKLIKHFILVGIATLAKSGQV